MGTIILQVPLSGQANSTEDPKIASDFTALQTLLNGNLDTNNLSPVAAILGSQLSSAAGIVNSQLVQGAGRLTARTITVGSAASPGDLMVCNGTFTVSIPDPAAGSSLNALIGVINNGSGVITVAAPGGAGILGVGISGASFNLGTVGSYAVLHGSGTNWCVIAGQQDTGWQALALTSGVVGGAYTPSVRMQGDALRLKGNLQNTTGGAIAGNATWATVPTALRPSAIIGIPAVTSNGPTTASVAAGGTGAISVVSSVGNGGIFYLDGITYTLS